jgi:hypothetical protein
MKFLKVLPGFNAIIDSVLTLPLKIEVIQFKQYSKSESEHREGLPTTSCRTDKQNHNHGGREVEK